MVGRPPKTWIGKEGPGPIHLELVKLQTRNLVQIGQPGRGCVAWLDEVGAFEAVLELAKPGQAVVWSWEPLGRRIEERREELKAIVDDRAAEQEMLALTERFLHLTVSKEGRITLHPQSRDHLGIMAKNDGRLYVVYFPTRLELWSQGFRAEIHEELEQTTDFPSPEDE